MEYTDFEEIPFNREYLERVRKTDKPTIEDFEKVFLALGFVKSGDSTFSLSMNHVVGKMVVNGVERVQNDTTTFSFLYDPEDFGDVDGDVCSGLMLSVSNNQGTVFEEKVYTRPEDVHLFTEIYLRK